MQSDVGDNHNQIKTYYHDTKKSLTLLTDMTWLKRSKGPVAWFNIITAGKGGWLEVVIHKRKNFLLLFAIKVLTCKVHTSFATWIISIEMLFENWSIWLFSVASLVNTVSLIWIYRSKVILKTMKLTHRFFSRKWNTQLPFDKSKLINMKFNECSSLCFHGIFQEWRFNEISAWCRLTVGV